MNLEKTAQTKTPDTLIQPATEAGEFVISRDFFYDEIRGSTDLEEVFHAVVALDSGATQLTMTVDEHAGSLYFADIYESALTRVYMASAIDPEARGTILDSKDTIKAAGVDIKDDVAVHQAIQQGYQGALRSIARMGDKYGVGGLELVNELAVLVKAKRREVSPLVLETNQLHELIDIAVINVRANTGEGKRYSTPLLSKATIASLPEDRLQQKVDEARQVLLVTAWPQRDRTQRKSVIYRGDEIKNRKTETTGCNCGGHGFHLQTCPSVDDPLPDSIEPMASNIISNFARNKAINPPSTN